jgi:8-oxo-dGTP pyrophosphatase MutT (NUDIX family)
MWLEEVERLLAAAPVLRRPLAKGYLPSAVLVPLYVAAGQLWVLLTRRTDTLPKHAGQYAFPGGVREEADEDEVAAALREAHEEIGLDSSSVVVLGHLNDVETPSGFLISPVVGAIPFPLKVRPTSEEVDAVVQIPFAYLSNPLVVEEQELEIAGEKVVSPVYHYRNHRIWGATARILADLIGRLTGGVPAAGE